MIGGGFVQALSILDPPPARFLTNFNGGEWDDITDENPEELQSQ